MQLIPRSAACCFCSTLEIHGSLFIYFHKLQIVNTVSTRHSSKHTPVGFSSASPVCDFELRPFSTPFPASSFPVKGLQVLDCNAVPSPCDGIPLSPLGQCSFPSLQPLIPGGGSSISSLHFIMGCCTQSLLWEGGSAFSVFILQQKLAAKFDGVSVQAELGERSASRITVMEEALHKHFGYLGT